MRCPLLLFGCSAAIEAVMQIDAVCMCPSEDGQGLTYSCCPVSVVCLHRALAPGPGIQAANAGLQSLTTTGIFVISGLNLKRGEALQARGTVTVTIWLNRLSRVSGTPVTMWCHPCAELSGCHLLLCACVHTWFIDAPCRPACASLTV